MSTSDINAYNISTTEVMLFLSKTNGEQKFGVLGNLAVNEQFGLNSRMFLNNLETEFIPWASITTGMTNGLEVNDLEVSFTQCFGLLRASKVILYQRSQESTLQGYLFGGDKPFFSSTLATDIYSKMTLIPGASRKVPDKFQTITHLYFGLREICGVYAFAGMDGVTAGGAIGFVLN
jgi:hypothetical protein